MYQDDIAKKARSRAQTQNDLPAKSGDAKSGHAGATARTAKLPPPAGAVQRKPSDGGATGAEQVPSAWSWTTDPRMDTAVRGSGGRDTPVQMEVGTTAPAEAEAPAPAPAAAENDPFEVDRGQLTFDAEGQEGGRFHSRTAHWPGGASGVTIGRGYDIGQQSRARVVEDLTGVGVSAGDADRFAGAAGLSGAAARTWLAENRDNLTEITPAQQEALFEVVYSRLSGDVERISHNYAGTIAGRTGQDRESLEIDWDTVHPAIRDVLVDLRYRGDYTPTTRQRVQAPAIANDLQALYEVMRDRDYWVGQRGVPRDRFERRVSFLEAALGRGQQPAEGQGEQPAAGGEQPAAGGEQPTAGGEQPAAGGEQQAAPGATAGATAEFVVTAGSLNVRSSPDTRSTRNIVGGLSSGDRVTGTPVGNGWVEIDFQGGRAFVSEQFVVPAAQAERGAEEEEAPEAAPSQPTAPAGGGEEEQPAAAQPAQPAPPPSAAREALIVTASLLNVRSSPDAGGSGNQVGALRRGTRIEGTRTGDGWIQFEFEGATAFVSAQFVAPATQAAPAPDEQAPAPSGDVRRSGAEWVGIANANGWVNDTSFSSLDSSWGPRAEAFVTGLRAAGASVTVSAGLRHPKRAFLMHYAWGVAHGQYTPAQANTACRGQGINIEWDHGNAAASRTAAQALVSAFHLVRQASITSNHIRGLAIDITISNLPGSITMNGRTYTTRAGASGTAAAESVAPIGRDMGVIWFGAGDRVHWSHNGR
ncbi:pesticin C-terminus-like muramidase [Haliangium sp.]|uniref:pesticin C-terminus-like muramidase n=1 Tax=Haliangium sp. TaxID=2663208 RepID=UPI003D1141C1